MLENAVNEAGFKEEAAAQQTRQRQRWMAVLARASGEELRHAWDAVADAPLYRFLRQPEIGLAMVRGRAGGTGTRFNLGEMTVTRCVVETDSGRIGHAYVAGRDTEKATLAALFDALLQDSGRAPVLQATLIDPLAALQKRRVRERQSKVAATKVDFFTMVRGD